MEPQGLLNDKDYFALAERLETAWELRVFLDACEQDYLERNPYFYRNLLFGVLRLRTTYVNKLTELLRENPDKPKLREKNIPKAKIQRLDEIKEYLEERQERIREKRVEPMEPIIRAAIDRHLPDFSTVSDPGTRGFTVIYSMFRQMSQKGIAKMLERYNELLEADKEKLDNYVFTQWNGDTLENTLLHLKKTAKFSEFFLAVATEIAQGFQKEKSNQDNQLTAQEWALYYFYLAETGNYPLLKSTKPGKAYEEITKALPKIKATTFGKYYRIVKNENDRLNGPNNAERVKKILPRLEPYPKALQMAESELTKILSRNK